LGDSRNHGGQGLCLRLDQACAALWDAADQPGILQLAQVMRQGRRGHARLGPKGAKANATSRGAQEPHQKPKALRMAKRSTGGGGSVHIHRFHKTRKLVLISDASPDRPLRRNTPNAETLW
jgi:hypothetical protein